MRTLPLAFWASVAGVAYGGLLVLLAFTLPVYSTDSSSSGAGSATLAGENDLGAVVLLPVAVAAGVFLLLHLVCRFGSRPALAAAWTLAGLAAVAAVLGAMTIGIFLVPLAALLVYACSATPRGRPRRA
jgi:hypothetical protein